MGSASGTSDSHGQSSNGHSSNGGESNSSNGNGSSNGGSGCGSSQGTGSGSGSESAGKDNSPTNDLDECEEGDQVLSELPRSSNRKRPHTPSQVKGASPSVDTLWEDVGIWCGAERHKRSCIVHGGSAGTRALTPDP